MRARASASRRTDGGEEAPAEAGVADLVGEDPGQELAQLALGHLHSLGVDDRDGDGLARRQMLRTLRSAPSSAGRPGGAAARRQPARWPGLGPEGLDHRTAEDAVGASSPANARHSATRDGGRPASSSCSASASKTAAEACSLICARARWRSRHRAARAPRRGEASRGGRRRRDRGRRSPSRDLHRRPHRRAPGLATGLRAPFHGRAAGVVGLPRVGAAVAHRALLREYERRGLHVEAGVGDGLGRRLCRRLGRRLGGRVPLSCAGSISTRRCSRAAW